MTEPRSETVEGESAAIPGQHARGGTLERDGHSPFTVVGIGASAGGLDAFGELLAHLPADTGMAFLLVQHLDPHHESRLSDLLSRNTEMPVLEATNGLAVRPNHVYVIPPNANLAISQGKLLLTPRGESRGPHLPVDYLFRSLAEDQRGRAIGVVLSGTGSDGTLGLCEIKAVGGITFAQEEQTASHAGMPRSAIDSGCIDFVNPVDGSHGVSSRSASIRT
jgi:two-component system CheB/CheR fusion protein